MYEDKDQIIRRERAEPVEGDRPWPLGMWIFLLCMCCVAFAYTLLFTGDGSADLGDFRHASPPIGAPPQDSSTEAAPSIAAGDENAAYDLGLGKQVYQNICLACHQSDGNGIPGAFPPLGGSRWVTDDAGTPIRVVLHGLAGPIEVKGQTYNGIMPGFAAQLNDEEVAAVVSHIRQSWGNDATPVSAELVAEIRQASGSRGPWSADELDSEK